MAKKPACVVYVPCPYSINTVSRYECGTYEGSTKVACTSKGGRPSFNNAVSFMSVDDLINHNSLFFFDKNDLPRIESYSYDENDWSHAYADKDNIYCSNYNRAFDNDKEATSYTNRTIRIDEPCIRHSTSDIPAEPTIGKVEKGSKISLGNIVADLYSRIDKRLSYYDKKYNGAKDHRNYMPPKLEVGDVPLPNFYIELNNALKEYEPEIQTININLKLITADDSINKVIDNYNRHFTSETADCICYSDCHVYSVCFCYGNCNHY